MVADLQQKLKNCQDELQRHMLEAQIRCSAYFWLYPIIHVASEILSLQKCLWLLKAMRIPDVARLILHAQALQAQQETVLASAHCQSGMTTFS